jgi:hypothetical protein
MDAPLRDAPVYGKTVERMSVVMREAPPSGQPTALGRQLPPQLTPEGEILSPCTCDGGTGFSTPA